MGILILVLNGLQLLILVDVVLSWIMPDKDRFPRNVTARVTDPLYAPFRNLINPEKTGGMDFSPLAVLVIIQLIQRMLVH
jgi:YggT family protein